MADNLVISGFTQAINFTAGGAGNNTVRPAVPSKRWMIFVLHLESDSSIDLIIKSGTVELTGALAITATTVRDFSAGGIPILKASDRNLTFVINTSGAGDVDGWALMAEIDE